MWSAGIWFVAGDVKENAYNKERLATAQATMKIIDSNAATAAALSKQLQDSLQKLAPTLAAINKDNMNEIATNPVYHDCRITDGVRNNYKRKLQAQ